MPLDASIGQVLTPYCPLADTMVINFGVKIKLCLVKSLSEASIQKAQNGPSTQLIKATSCIEIERSNNTMKAEELS